MIGLAKILKNISKINEIEKSLSYTQEDVDSLKKDVENG